jgi:aminoglycoside phosphotransferase (APT) family kinase protein
VTAFVDVATVRAAAERAGRLTLTPAETQRWAQLLDHASAQGADPTRERATALRAVLGLGADVDDADVLAAAGERLKQQLDDPSDRTAAEVLSLCRQWFHADVAAAAPLLDLFTGHHQDPAGGPPAADPDMTRRLESWLSERIGSPVRIDEARVLSGGFSRLMLAVRWLGGSGDGRAVFRIEQDGMFATDGAREVLAMRAVRAADYPAPKVLWQERDRTVIGEPFFVMEHVDGAARTDEAGLDDMLRALGRLHNLDRTVVDSVAALDGVAPGSGPQAAIDAQLAHWHRVYREALPVPLPLLERCFAWLRHNLRPTGPSVIVHGDPGPGNALQDEHGVAAVIDWEFTHAGDAAEDWAYLALIRGRKLAGPAEWKARIAATVGVEFDEPTWLAWEVYNNVKGACVNLTALGVFARSPRPNPDLLAIGVAVHLRFLARAIELTGTP